MIRPEARELFRWAKENAGDFSCLLIDLPKEKPDPYFDFCEKVNFLLDDPNTLASELPPDLLHISNLSAMIEKEPRRNEEKIMRMMRELAQAMREAYETRLKSQGEGPTGPEAA